MNWIARHRRIAFAIICALWAALIISLLLASNRFPNVRFLSLVQRGEQAFEDLLRREGRKTPARRDFVFVGIDQQSLQLDNIGPEEITGNRAFELMTERPFPGRAKSGSFCLIGCSEPGAPGDFRHDLQQSE